MLKKTGEMSYVLVKENTQRRGKVIFLFNQV